MVVKNDFADFIFILPKVCTPPPPIHYTCVIQYLTNKGSKHNGVESLGINMTENQPVNSFLSNVSAQPPLHIYPLRALWHIRHQQNISIHLCPQLQPSKQFKTGHIFF